MDLKLAAVLKGEHTVAGVCPFSLKNGLPGAMANCSTPLGVAKVTGLLKNTEAQNTVLAGVGKTWCKQVCSARWQFCRGQPGRA